MEADIWSVGVVFYQLLYGKYPFMGMSDNEILKKIEQTRPNFSGVNLSENARNFIDRCLTDNPQKRISWLEIYQHPLIKEGEKMLYGLTSRINIKQAEDFYKKPVEVETDLMNTQHKKMSEFENVVQPGQANLEKVQKEAEEQRKMASAGQKYEKLYLNHRNNIMFIFKFVTPYIHNIFNIHANHDITLFILSKKSFLQMKAFHHHVKSKGNYFKLANYFN